MCTAQELSDNEASGSGCSYDATRIWSSTVCFGDGGLVGHLTQAGSSDYLRSVGRTCSAPEDLVAVRCCADAQLYPPAPPLVALESPRSLRVEASSCTNLSLYWEPPRGAYPADGYVVYWVADWEREGRVARPTGGATQLAVSGAEAHIGGLQPGTGYMFWVAARNVAGMGAWSNGLEAATRPADAPPRAPRAPVLGSTPRGECAALRMRIPKEGHGAGCRAALSLALQHKSTSTRTWSMSKQHLMADTEVVVDSLDPLFAYSFRLVAFNQAGSSEPSDAIGPLVVGMAAGFAEAQPRAWATSSTTIVVDWGDLTSSCQSAVEWKVLYHLADSKTAIWRLLTAGHTGTRLRAELQCPDGCVFKVAPLVSGFAGSSAASKPTTAMPMRPVVDGAARLLMLLAISPDELELTSQEIESFESETAAVLAVSRQRVKIVETRPLASEWQVVFDILPDHSAGAVDGLASTLAVLLHTPESELFMGDVTRHLNGTAGLRRLVPREGSATTYDVHTVGSGRRPAEAAGMGMQLPAAVAIAAICTLLVYRWGRDGRSQGHGYGLPGDTSVVDGGAEDEHRAEDFVSGERPSPLDPLPPKRLPEGVEFF